MLQELPLRRAAVNIQVTDVLIYAVERSQRSYIHKKGRIMAYAARWCIFQTATVAIEMVVEHLLSDFHLGSSGAMRRRDRWAVPLFCYSLRHGD